MSDRIDYRYNAEEQVKLALSLPQSENEVPALVVAQIATAEAVLALVEQQRIANLIAFQALAVTQNHQGHLLDKDGWAQVDSVRYEIQEGLGL